MSQERIGGIAFRIAKSPQVAFDSKVAKVDCFGDSLNRLAMTDSVDCHEFVSVNFRNDDMVAVCANLATMECLDFLDSALPNFAKTALDL